MIFDVCVSQHDTIEFFYLIETIMDLAAELQFFYNEKYKLYFTCLIRHYSLEKIRESRHFLWDFVP